MSTRYPPYLVDMYCVFWVSCKRLLRSWCLVNGFGVLSTPWDYRCYMNGDSDDDVSEKHIHKLPRRQAEDKLRGKKFFDEGDRDQMIAVHKRLKAIEVGTD